MTDFAGLGLYLLINLRSFSSANLHHRKPIGLRYTSISPGQPGQSNSNKMLGTTLFCSSVFLFSHANNHRNLLHISSRLIFSASACRLRQTRQLVIDELESLAVRRSVMVNAVSLVSVTGRERLLAVDN